MRSLRKCGVANNLPNLYLWTERKHSNASYRITQDMLGFHPLSITSLENMMESLFFRDDFQFIQQWKSEQSERLHKSVRVPRNLHRTTSLKNGIERMVGRQGNVFRFSMPMLLQSLNLNHQKRHPRVILTSSMWFSCIILLSLKSRKPKIHLLHVLRRKGTSWK